MQNTEFGYSRKDIILLGAGLIGLGYALYYGLQVRCIGSISSAFSSARWPDCIIEQNGLVIGLMLYPSKSSVESDRPGSGHNPVIIDLITTCPSSCPLLQTNSIIRKYRVVTSRQATGMEAGKSGNVVQITIFLGICVGYISTYIFRVANKVRACRLL